MVFCATKRMVDEVVGAAAGARLSRRGDCTATSASRRARRCCGRSATAAPRCWSRPTSPRAASTSPTSASSSTSTSRRTRSTTCTASVAPGASAAAARRSRSSTRARCGSCTRSSARPAPTSGALKRRPPLEGEEREAELLATRLQEVLAKDGWARFRGVVEQMSDDHDPADIAAAALALAATSGAGRRSHARTRVAPEPAPVPERTQRPPARDRDEHAKPRLRWAHAHPKPKPKPKPGRATGAATPDRRSAVL